MITIYTVGYQGVKREQLDAKAKELGALIVDTRYSAWSSDPEYTKKALLEHFGGQRYAFMGNEFGNLNYKDRTGTLPIKIANFDAGWQTLQSRILREDPIMLMCACWQWTTCHRKVVSDMMLAKLKSIGLEPKIVHITRSDMPTMKQMKKRDDSQSSLF